MHYSWVFPRGFTSLYAYYSLLCMFYARFMHKFGAYLALVTLYMSVYSVISNTIGGISCLLWTYGIFEFGSSPL